MFKLSPHQFATVFEGLRLAGKSDGSERRQHTRMDVQASVKLAWLQGEHVGHCSTALTRDISTSGVGMFQCTPAENDARFLLAAPTHGTELLIVCVPQFCRVLAQGIFVIGASFESLANVSMTDQFKKAEVATTNRIKNAILA